MRIFIVIKIIMTSLDQDYVELVKNNKDLTILLYEVRLRMNKNKNDNKTYLFWRRHYDDLHEEYMNKFYTMTVR